jgi:hypothetical protein
MQTLKQRPVKPNTPTSASQARSNCGVQLNRDQSLSAAGSKTCFNNPEVNLFQRAEKPKVMVLVISIDGKPLMPCKPAKAKKLLKSNRAKVVCRLPFTVKLKFECENQVQEITAGIDTGYKNVGVSFVTAKREVFSAEIILDGKTKERMTTKRMYRRGRRNKLRYRQPRFLNRKKRIGLLPPSVQRKVDTHINFLTRLARFIPITKVRIEGANFDIQKIMNPEISGTGYQQGNLYDYENAKAFILQREQGKCQLCGEGYDKNGWHLHHIRPRAKDGTDRVDNLALLHESCHKKLHKQNLHSQLKRAKEYKAETFMSTARPFILKKLKEYFVVEETFGYITKLNRIESQIEKSHESDAFVISSGTNQERCATLLVTQKHRNNRSLGKQRNGFAPSTRKQRYPIQPKDLVWIAGKKAIVNGTHNLGKRIVLQNKKSVDIKKIEKAYHFGSLVYEFKKCA